MIINTPLKTLLVLIFAGLLSACGTKSEENKSEGKSLSVNAEIDSLESMRSEDAIRFYQTGHGKLLALAYEKFAEKTKNDLEAAEKLFLAAKEYQGAVKDPQKAVELIEKLEKGYPEYGKMPEALFYLGFIYENELKDMEKAEKYYKKVIEKYPDHRFAEQAKAAIELLGMSPEEVIEQFKKNQEAE